MNANKSVHSLARQNVNRFAILNLLEDEVDDEPLDSSSFKNTQISRDALRGQSFPFHSKKNTAFPDGDCSDVSNGDLSLAREGVTGYALGRDIEPTKTEEHSRNESLCGQCQTIFRNCQILDEFGDGPMGRRHYLQYASFHRAVEAGCYICSLLAQNIESLSKSYQQAENRLLEIEQRFMSLEYHISHEELEPYLFFTYTEQDSTMHYPILGLRLLDPSEVQPNLYATFLEKSTSSQQNMRLVSHWLQKCCIEHEKCRTIAVATRTLPSRLLDIESIDKVHLCNGSTLSPSASYLTLSHCWGREPIYSLLSRNIEELSKHIQTDKLPNVFRDAIFMTHLLGFRYLWIDSLCIIQDSKDDWVKEAPRMGGVYRRAACNLAATGFSDGRNGLFSTRDGKLLSPLKVHVDWDGVRPQRGIPIRGEYYLSDDDHWKSSVCNAPLNRRAWVVQERILSPRIIHFGDKQLLWECYELKASEAFPYGLDYKHATGNNLKNDLHESDLQASCSYWRQIVQAYSKGHLTFSQDKLPAIEGIAMEMSTPQLGRYIAGLWEGDILYMLLWRVEKPSQFIKLPATYRAPTWSWASIDDEVSYRHAMRNADLHHKGKDNPPEVIYSDIVSVTSTPLTGYLAGATIQWSIRIQGPLRRAMKTKGNFVVRHGVSWRGWEVNLKPLKINLAFDVLSYTEKKTKNLYRKPDNDTKKEGAFIRDSSFCLLDAAVDHVFLMPIRSDWEDLYNFQVEMYGLVLYPTGQRRGEFYRIGSFAVEEKKDQKIVLETLDVLEDFDFEEVDGFGQYTITIV